MPTLQVSASTVTLHDNRSKSTSSRWEPDAETFDEPNSWNLPPNKAMLLDAFELQERLKKKSKELLRRKEPEEGGGEDDDENNSNNSSSDGDISGCIASFSVDCAHFQEDPGSNFTALAPVATRLTSLTLFNCGIDATISAISPLLVAPLAFQSLKTLSLALACDDLDGLFSTLAACCPKLTSLHIFRDEGTDDGAEGGADDDFGPWRVRLEDLELLVKKVPLRKLGLEMVEVDDSWEGLECKKDEEDEGSATYAADLWGISLVRCAFKRDFVRLLSRASRNNLVYFELVGSWSGEEDFGWGGENKEQEQEELDVGSSVALSEVIAMLAEYSSQTLKNLCLHGMHVKDSDVKTIGMYFKNLVRLSLGEYEGKLNITGQSFKFLSRTVLNQLNCLHLIGGGGGAQEKEMLNTGTKLLDRGIADEHFESYFDAESNGLRELILSGFAGISPTGIANFVGQGLERLEVRGCSGFYNPAEVCRLCRVNESLVIQEVDTAVELSGSFRAAFYDCEDENDEDRES
jgi:hypothetical protein